MGQYDDFLDNSLSEIFNLKRKIIRNVNCNLAILRPNCHHFSYDVHVLSVPA